MMPNDDDLEAVNREIDYYRRRRSEIEQRGTAVVTTSGVLVTLLLGLANLVSSAESFVAPGPAKVLLGAAVIVFLGAAVLGLLVHLPRFDVDVLSGMTASERTEFRQKVREIEMGRVVKQNERLILLLVGALTLEVAALALVGSSVLVILWDS